MVSLINPLISNIHYWGHLMIRTVRLYFKYQSALSSQNLKILNGIEDFEEVDKTAWGWGWEGVKI